MKPTNAKNRSTNMVFKGGSVSGGGGITRVKTDGRIGSPTPKSYVKGGMTVDNNRKAGPNAPLGGHAASHLSPSHSGGVWSPRAAKARAMATPYPREHGHPINHAKPAFVKVKPK